MFVTIILKIQLINVNSLSWYLKLYAEIYIYIFLCI